MGKSVKRIGNCHRIEEHVGASCPLQMGGQSPFSGENRGFPVGGPVGKVQRHGASFINVIVSLSFYVRHQHHLPCRVWRHVRGWLKKSLTVRLARVVHATMCSATS